MFRLQTITKTILTSSPSPSGGDEEGIEARWLHRHEAVEGVERQQPRDASTYKLSRDKVQEGGHRSAAAVAGPSVLLSLGVASRRPLHHTRSNFFLVATDDDGQKDDWALRTTRACLVACIGLDQARAGSIQPVW